MRKIVVETSIISNPYVGVGEFCLNLGEHLAKKANELKEKYDVELYFIVPKGKIGCFGNEVSYIELKNKIQVFWQLFWLKPDLVHLTHQYAKIKYYNRGRKCLLTVHDINFMYEKVGMKLKRYCSNFAKKIRKSTHISFISEFAKKDTETYFSLKGKPNFVVYNGVKDLMISEDYRPDFATKIQSSYLFHISSLLPKKNVHLLVKMMDYLPEFQLVIVGNWASNYAKELLQQIEKSQHQNILSLNNISTQDKAYLMKNCKALVFPSECEGFGLPPIETMKFGNPVFLSTKTSLPEIGGEEAFYWEDLQPEKMAKIVREQLSTMTIEKEQKIRQFAQRYDWEKCVNEYIDVYKEILQLN